MKTLTIEHVKAYPFGDNGLRVLRPDGRTILPVYGIVGNLIVHNENNELIYSGLSGCRPIYHPLSDLTKEIEHNGEKFVPIIELAKENIPEEEWCRLYTNSDGKEFFQCMYNTGGEDDDLIIGIYESMVDLTRYDYMQKLFEWHFDLFGLIEDGLAIDINTL